MRMTRLFSQTLREAPADADSASHRLRLRIAYNAEIRSTRRLPATYFKPIDNPTDLI